MNKKRYFTISWLCFILSIAHSQNNVINRHNQAYRVTIPMQQGIAPYKPVYGGYFSDRAIPASPDPLISYHWEHETNDLQVYHLKPVHVMSDKAENFQNITSILGENCDVLVNGEGYLCFDFGVESAAWLEFDSPDFNGEVSMSISEYNKPAIVNSGPPSPYKTAKPVKHGNTYRLELNIDLYEGARFGWIHVTKFDKPWHLKDIRLVCQAKPINYKGHFRSSDTMLNRIWYTGAYTVKLNLLEDDIGAILIDRGDRHSWTGDAYISQGASMSVFGNYEMVKHNLQRTSADDNGIESYSLLWIHSLLDYYYYSGDDVFFRTHLGTIKRKMEHAANVYKSETNLLFYGWDERLGAGFEDPNIPENRYAYRLLYIQTCRALSKGLIDLGENELSREYSLLVNEQLNMLRSNPSWLNAIGLHATAEAINGGYLTLSEQQTLVNRHFLDTTNIISFSPFNQYFIIKAMANAGMYSEALYAIDRAWGGQIRLGGTTFWECYRPEWNDFLQPNEPVPNGQHGYTSLCHPWSSGVTRWLSEEILGIKPISPGFQYFQVIPQLSDKLNAVGGEVPTPLGTIQFDIDVNKGVAHLHSPEGSKCTLGIPKMGKQIRRILINGIPISSKKEGKNKFYAGTKEDEDFMYIQDLISGTYMISVEYISKKQSKNKRIEIKDEQKPSIRLVTVDSVTTGWSDQYGKDGYLLFDNSGGEVNRNNLPDYITNIVWKTGGIGAPRLGQWSFEKDQPIGILATQNPRACFQTFYVDILANHQKNYQFTLSMIELGETGKFTVDIFDYDTKNLIYPTLAVHTSGKNKYYTFTTDRPVRVRLSHLEGGDAAIEGIFFQ